MSLRSADRRRSNLVANALALMHNDGIAALSFAMTKFYTSLNHLQSAQLLCAAQLVLPMAPR
jgi:hypothetical protein